ncbi:unnamed protein product [Cylicocyclus nassatus]|uniref:Uncharacterized protein n=1 Tax=Cylicocyclus nassatus TaxID=53992 RepID=A0AA36GSK1_CYLNA|nr:unnamed protein product [Cylicocyclus nassatus]
MSTLRLLRRSANSRCRENLGISVQHVRSEIFQKAMQKMMKECDELVGGDCKMKSRLDGILNKEKEVRQCVSGEDHLLLNSSTTPGSNIQFE